MPTASQYWLTIPPTFSDFLDYLLHQHHYASQYDGPYDLITHNTSSYSFRSHLFDISFKGACSPLNGITNMNTISMYSPFRCDRSDANMLRAVGSSGGLCSITFSHRQFIDRNSTQYRTDPSKGSQQIFTPMTLRNSLVPSKTPFRPARSPTSRFLTSRVATEPTAVKEFKMLVDRNMLCYLPVQWQERNLGAQCHDCRQG